MINTLRVVIDTNVLISGLFGSDDSPPFQILQSIRSQKVILVTSPIILEEVVEVINREKLAKLLKMTPTERNDFMNMLIERSNVTEGKQLSYVVGRDEKDDKFIACGVEGNAGYIITGDQDLLVLNEFEGMKIVTPREFLKVLMC